MIKEKDSIKERGERLNNVILRQEVQETSRSDEVKVGRRWTSCPIPYDKVSVESDDNEVGIGRKEKSSKGEEGDGVGRKEEEHRRANLYTRTTNIVSPKSGGLIGMCSINTNNKPKSIGLCGYGTVGGGIIELLRDNTDYKIKKKLVRDINKKRDIKPPKDTIMVTDYNEIINDESIEIIIEVIGGKEIAKEITLKGIKAGKHIISANKELISEIMELIEEEIKLSKSNIKFLYEGAVCGGIPIISTLQRGLISEKITKITGIMNGTTNYI